MQTKIQSYCWNEFLGLKHRMIVDKINRGKGKQGEGFVTQVLKAKQLNSVIHCI